MVGFLKGASCHEGGHDELYMVKRLPNGNLLVPKRAQADDGTVGEAWEEIAPDHPDYKTYLKEISRRERILGKKRAE